MSDARQVIQNVRNKYPQYNHLNDYELLESLKKKYPQYNHLVLPQELSKSENVLGRTMKSFTKPFTDNKNPLQTANIMNPAFGAYQGLHNVKSDFVGNNPVVDFLTDPELAIAGTSAVKGGVNLGKFMLNPSKEYGKALSKPGKVDYFPDLMRSMDDPVVNKVLQKSNVMDQFGGRTLGEGGAVSERLSNLSPKESQDIVNLLKGGVRKGVVEGDVDPKHLEISKLFTNLSKAQNVGTPGLKSAKRMYGVSMGLRDIIDRVARRAAWGAEFGGGYELGKGLVKKIFFGV